MNRHRGDIAIIGMACIFPGAPDIKTFWQNIVNKVDAVTDPPDDWGGEPWFDPHSTANDRIYCKRGGYLGELSRFDPLQYGVMPTTVDGAEPEHFLALRAAYEALADASVPHIPLNRQRTEVIIGRGTFINRGYTTLHQHGLIIEQTLRLLQELHPEYTKEKLQTLKQHLEASLPPFNAETAPGLVSTIMSGRIANRLDLKGTNYCVDSACSSSLTAVQLGVQDLLTGKCDTVLAGGVQLSTHHLTLMVFCRLGALSRSSQIRPFDQGADGTLLGEGVGMVVLKRRKDAEQDGNRIYALIKAVGSSSDGRGKSVIAPRVEGEELAVRRAYEEAGISPATVGLIETHGTAMPLGDLTEIQALNHVFGVRDPGPPRCAIGSVKSMIGHLIPAAGIAGLIKTALALYHKTLPPTLHCEQPNPKLEIEKTSFYINNENRPWIHGTPNAPRRAGINAFGFGGINAHAVLEEYTGGNESEAETYYRDWDTELFVFQADSREELIEQGEKVLGYLSISPMEALIDLAYTINSKLGDKPYRLAIVASSSEDLAKKVNHALTRLRDCKRLRIKNKSGIYFFEEPLGRQGKLAFLFPGEGSQYVNMLSDLCLHFPEVRFCFDLLDRAFADHPRNYLPSDFIFPPPTNSEEDQATAEERLWRMDGAVDAVITADRALFRLFNLLDIRPQVIVGHSSGEFMALEAAGVLDISSEQELIQHIIAGNRMIERLAIADKNPEIQLVAVGAVDRTLISQIVEKTGGKLFTAMDNCPNQVVLCGNKDTMDKAVDQLQGAGAICQMLPFARPYHTPMFEAACGPLQDFFNNLKIVTPNISLYSCLSTGPYPQDPEEVRRLAVEQWARPVRFRETIDAMYGGGVCIFLEVGPRENLTGFVNDILKGKTFLAVPSNVDHRSGITQLNHALGLLAAHGVPMRLDYLYKRRMPRELNLETIGTPATDRKAEKSGPKLSLALPMLSLRTGETVASEESQADQILRRSSGEVDLENRPSVQALRSTQPSGQDNDSVRPNTVEPPASPLPREDTPVSGAARHQATVMEEYLRTMESFLDLQQQVVQTYLAPGDSANTQTYDGETSDFRVSPESSRISESRETASAAESVFPDRDVSDVLPVSLSADREESSSEAKTVPTSRFSSALDREGIEKLLLSCISEKTGYPLDSLTLNQNLEADLGIDFVKRLEIMGTLKQRVGTLDADEMDRLTGFKTLQQMSDFLWQRQGNQKADVGLSVPLSGADESAEMPFIGTIISHTPGEELSALREFSLDEDIFLLDHTLGREVSVTDRELTGLPMMPLTVSMEIMAEAAVLLLPNKVFVGMRDIRAYRWITFEQKRLTLKVAARRQSPDEVRVQVREANDVADAGNLVGLPLVEGTMIFGASYPEPPALDDFSLRGRRRSRWSPDNLYSEGMFSGPSFQGMASVDWWGEDGVEATLRALPLDGFFQSRSAPRFVIDPVLLDAAGQLVAYWVADHRETGFNVYPFRVGALHIYGPNFRPPEQTKCRVRIQSLAENQLRSNIDVIGPDGRLRMRLVGWDDRSFDLPASFYRVRFRPREVMLSTPWPAPISRFPQADVLECCRMEDFPDQLLHAHGRVWQSVLAHLVLSRHERKVWRKLPGLEKRRTEWLLARVAGKDAVRLFLKEKYDMKSCPADIEILNDEYGRPVAAGDLINELGCQLSVSIAHWGKGSAAVAGEYTGHEGVGIDVEPLEQSHEGLEEIAFTIEEGTHLSEVPVSRRKEWLLRLWCAKEAVAKALGRGLMGNPRNLMVEDVDVESGRVNLRVARELARGLSDYTDKSLTAYTGCDGALVFATSFI